MLPETYTESKPMDVIDRPCGHCGEPHAHRVGFPFTYSDLQVCLRCRAKLEAESFGDPLRHCSECGRACPDEDLYPAGQRVLCRVCLQVEEALHLLAIIRQMISGVLAVLEAASQVQREGKVGE